MLSKSLHEQIFGECDDVQDSESIRKSIEHLSDHDLYGRSKNHIADVRFKLPKLKGENIAEHFEIIAKEQSTNYFEMAQRLSRMSLPPRPTEWNFEPGWTKYELRENSIHALTVECPEGEVMVFDVEVCVNEGQFPTLAVLATPDSWYVYLLQNTRNFSVFLFSSNIFAHLSKTRQ